MTLITIFPTYEAAESILENYLQRNRDVIGTSQGFTVAERKQAGVENPLAESGKELTLLVDLYWFAGNYAFDAGILTLTDIVAEQFPKEYTTLKGLASEVKMKINEFQQGKFEHLYGRCPEAHIVPFIYTIEDHHDPQESNLSDNQEKTRPFLDFLEESLGYKPVVRGLDEKEREEFVREYDKL